MTRAGDITARFASGERLVMVDPGQAGLPDDLAGADAVFIDREGTGLTRADAAALVDSAAHRGLASVIRGNGFGAAELRTCASLSPDAVVLPQLKTAEELRSAVPEVAERTAIIAQIETVEAVAHLAEFATVDGVAAFLIGPNDLATAMGHRGAPDHPEVIAAVEGVATDLSAAGRPFGLPAPSRAALDTWTARGAQLFYVPLAAFWR